MRFKGRKKNSNPSFYSNISFIVATLIFMRSSTSFKMQEDNETILMFYKRPRFENVSVDEAIVFEIRYKEAIELTRFPVWTKE